MFTPSARPDGETRHSTPNARPIPRVDNPSRAYVERLLRSDREPTILRGLTDDWAMMKQWTPSAFSKRFGEKTISALVDLPLTGVTLPGGQASYEKQMRFDKYIEHMMSNPALPCYLAYTRLEDAFPELKEDCQFDELAGPGRMTPDTRLWIGSGGTRSMLHADLKDNFFVQTFGTKKVLMASPHDTPGVYPFRDNIVNSEVNPDQPDFERFPRFRDVDLLEATLAPGDMLFIPRGWWHYLRSLEPSISVNYFFGKPLVFADYARQLLQLGVPYWVAAVRDLVRYGLLKREYKVDFFFSPPPTGKRLFDFLRTGDFSKENDPATDGEKHPGEGS